jgi:hypothetical protein
MVPFRTCTDHGCVDLSYDAWMVPQQCGYNAHHRDTAVESDFRSSYEKQSVRQKMARVSITICAFAIYLKNTLFTSNNVVTVGVD